MFEKITALIQKYPTIIIHRHTRPDGDAIGSQTGLKLILKENFPQKTVLSAGDGPGRYSFIKGSKPDEVADCLYKDALAIILDTSSASLISDSRWETAAETARIDHHLFCGEIARTEVIDSSSESCAGLVAAFAMEAGLKVCEDAAKAIFTGMVTDSGRFLYDSTSAKTFERASFLMRSGFDAADIYRNLYEDDFENVKRKADYTRRIEFTPNRVAYVYTDAKQAEETGMDPFSISRAFVNTMANIRGTGIWVSFTESDNGILCELRSNGKNINPVAVKYGGGGHAKASGATVKTKEEAYAMLDDLNTLAGQE